MAVGTTDVAGALGRTAPVAGTPEAAQWEYWIARAYRLIEGRYGDTYATLDPAAVDSVVTEAVAEHIRAWTPELVRRKDISIDDGRKSVDYFASVGPLAIPDALWAELDPDPVVGDVFSVQMTGTPDTGVPWPSGGYWA